MFVRRCQHPVSKGFLFIFAVVVLAPQMAKGQASPPYLRYTFSMQYPESTAWSNPQSAATVVKTNAYRWDALAVARDSAMIHFEVWDGPVSPPGKSFRRCKTPVWPKDLPTGWTFQTIPALCDCGPQRCIATVLPRGSSS